MLMQKLKHSFSLKKRQRWPKQICMLAKNTCLDVRWWTEIVVALKPIRKIHIEIKCVVPLVRRVDPISSCILHDDSCQFPRSLDSQPLTDQLLASVTLCLEFCTCISVGGKLSVSKSKL